MVTFIHNSPDGPCSHAAHRGFGNSINAKFYDISPDRLLSHFPYLGFLTEMCKYRWAAPPQDDIYILEYSSFVWATPAIYKENPDAIIILLASNIQGIARPSSAEKDGNNRIESIVRDIERYLGRSLLDRMIKRHIDGIIAVSPMVRNYCKVAYPNTPAVTARPYIQPQLYESLKSVTPSYESKVAITVSDPRVHKKISELVEQWHKVRQVHEDAELWIVGDGHPERFENNNGVKVLGYVENLDKIYSKASLYVHPAVNDSSPVATLEALLAGVPIIITESCGTKEEAKKLASWLVTESPKSIYKSINRYFDLEATERAELGNKSKKIGNEFSADKLTQFSTEYQKLLNIIQS